MLELGMLEVFNDMDGNFEIEGAKLKLHEIFCKKKWSKPTYKREIFQDMAPLLWNSSGTIDASLQEIVLIYPVLSSPNLTTAQSNRVCNALALLQCVASHQDTRMPFLNAQIPLYMYPFLKTTSKLRP